MATIAAAAIGAAGSIAGGVLSSQGAKSAASAGKGQIQNIPLPNYASALGRYASRLTAANATAVAPTFGEWLSSGGQAKFPVANAGLNPLEAARLGLIDPKTGRPVPFYDPNTQNRLTPEQVLYLGQQRRRKFGDKATGPAATYADVSQRLDRLEGQQQTQDVKRRETKVGARKAKLERRLGLEG